MYQILGNDEKEDVFYFKIPITNETNNYTIYRDPETGTLLLKIHTKFLLPNEFALEVIEKLKLAQDILQQPGGQLSLSNIRKKKPRQMRLCIRKHPKRRIAKKSKKKKKLILKSNEKKKIDLKNIEKKKMDSTGSLKKKKSNMKGNAKTHRSDCKCTESKKNDLKNNEKKYKDDVKCNDKIPAKKRPKNRPKQQKRRAMYRRKKPKRRCGVKQNRKHRCQKRNYRRIKTYVSKCRKN